MNKTIVSETQAALIYRYHERLYRLALLNTGSEKQAAALVEHAFHTLPEHTPTPEALLIRAMAHERPPRRLRYPRISQSALDRAMIDRSSAAALLDTLATATPTERMVIGLRYLWGIQTDEIASILGPEIAVDHALAHFRASVAHIIGLVPEHADIESLAEIDLWLDNRLDQERTLELRRATLEQAETRELRAAVLAAREALPRVLPALFAAIPPEKLTERLLQHPPEIHHFARSRQIARSALAAFVLIAAFAIILVPSFLARPAPTSRAAPPVAADLIEAAIQRFEQPPLQSGVLHEQYRIQEPGEQAFLIDRWYDYAPPNRLRISVRIDDRSEPLIEIASDGQNIIQYRYGNNANRFGRTALDVRIPSEEIQAVLPRLRTTPSYSPFGGRWRAYADVAPIYLGAARAVGADFLGQINVAGRDAYLLAYTTSSANHTNNTLAPGAKVLLAIDTQTYALLEITIVEDNTAEGMAIRPLQAQIFDLQPAASEQQFTLPDNDQVIVRSNLPSPRMPEIGAEQLISLEQAWRNAPDLLVPGNLPEDMRGMALTTRSRDNTAGVGLIYEGANQSLILWPRRSVSGRPSPADEQIAGDYRYRLLPMPFGRAVSNAAEVYRADYPEQRITIILIDEYATENERLTVIQQVITSLTPITLQNLAALQRNFYTSMDA